MATCSRWYASTARRRCEPGLVPQGAKLVSKIKPILLRNAVEPVWHRMDPIKMGHISKEVHRTVPWLLCFEENWATAWEGEGNDDEEELAKDIIEHDEQASANAVAEEILAVREAEENWAPAWIKYVLTRYPKIITPVPETAVTSSQKVDPSKLVPHRQQQLLQSSDFETALGLYAHIFSASDDMDAAEEELALAQRRCAELKVKLALKRKKPERPSGSTAAGVGVGAAKEGIDVVEEGRRTGVDSGMAEKSKGRRPAKPSEKVRLNLADAKAVKEARVTAYAVDQYGEGGPTLSIRRSPKSLDYSKDESWKP
ncbi:hypothetical protein V8E54_002469 [Elaphomyces granulatus]